MNDRIKEYTELLRGMLSKKRFTHSVNVADMCFRLANIFGEDPVIAYTAGLIHDIQKEVDPETMKSEVLLSDMDVDPVELEAQPLWHAVAGAYYAREKLKIDDTDVLNAIRYHTVGRDRMSKLELIVFLGDLVSAERDYKDVEKFRSLALDNLENAMLEATKWSIGKQLSKGGKIPMSTFRAYNFYLDYAKK